MFPPLEPGPLQLIDVEAHIPPRGGPVFAPIMAELLGRLEGVDAAAALPQSDVGQANADDLADEWATSGARLQRTVADETAAPLPAIADEQRRTDDQAAGVGGVREKLPGIDEPEPVYAMPGGSTAGVGLPRFWTDEDKQNWKPIVNPEDTPPVVDAIDQAVNSGTLETT